MAKIGTKKIRYRHIYDEQFCGRLHFVISADHYNDQCVSKKRNKEKQGVSHCFLDFYLHGIFGDYTGCNLFIHGSCIVCHHFVLHKLYHIKSCELQKICEIKDRGT